MVLPESIRAWAGDRIPESEDIGMSGASVFYLSDLVLKIEEDNRESRNNLSMLQWLKGKIPVPDVLVEASWIWAGAA